MQVEAQGRQFSAFAEAVVDPERVADFLALRLKHRPIFIGLLMRLEGLPLHYRRADLVRFASKKTLVILHPDPELTKSIAP